MARLSVIRLNQLKLSRASPRTARKRNQRTKTKVSSILQAKNKEANPIRTRRAAAQVTLFWLDIAFSYLQPRPATMGKKRNNAAKKKQATKKKKQKLSSAYGVSVLKGGTIAQNNGVLPANAIADGSNAKKQTNGSSSQHNASGNSMLTSSGANTGRRSLGSTNNEHDEFHRMHASLEERSLALQKQKDDHRRSKKTRQKQQKKKGWGGKFATPGTNFAPATLTLAPKTTQQLVDDAADHIAIGMNESGQRSSMISTDAMGGVEGARMAIPGKSSLSAAAGVNWQTRVSNVSNSAQQEEAQQQNNPFAAFDEDSDSDTEWGEQKSKPVPKFQFQPASFSFQPTFANPPPSATVVAEPGADIDPDL